MWKIGTRVRIIKSNRFTTPVGIIGTVVYIRKDKNDRFIVEFDEPMGGHSGNGAYKGKQGYCWWFDYRLEKVTATDGIKIEQVKRKNNYY